MAVGWDSHEAPRGLLLAAFLCTFSIKDTAEKREAREQTSSPASAETLLQPPRLPVSEEQLIAQEPWGPHPSDNARAGQMMSAG